MRSGPSAAITSCSARRQRKRNGGPSGTSATASIGSGRVSSRSGRGASSASAADNGGTPLQPVIGVAVSAPAQHLGQFGNMAVLRDQPAYAARAQPCAQAIDQADEFGPRLPRRRCRSVRAGGARRPAPTAAPCRSRNRDRMRRPAWRAARRTARGCRPGHATAARSRRRCGVPRRRCGTVLSSMRRAPSPRRSSADCQAGAPAARLMAVRPRARDRLWKALLGDIRRDRQARRQRLWSTPKRAIELAQQRLRRSGGQRRARQIDDIADALEADARERSRRSSAQPQRGKR